MFVERFKANSSIFWGGENYSPVVFQEEDKFVGVAISYVPYNNTFEIFLYYQFFKGA